MFQEVEMPRVNNHKYNNAYNKSLNSKNKTYKICQNMFRILKKIKNSQRRKLKGEQKNQNRQRRDLKE